MNLFNNIDFLLAHSPHHSYSREEFSCEMEGGMHLPDQLPPRPQSPQGHGSLMPPWAGKACGWGWPGSSPTSPCPQWYVTKALDSIPQMAPKAGAQGRWPPVSARQLGAPAAHGPQRLPWVRAGQGPAQMAPQSPLDQEQALSGSHSWGVKQILGSQLWHMWRAVLAAYIRNGS